MGWGVDLQRLWIGYVLLLPVYGALLLGDGSVLLAHKPSQTNTKMSCMHHQRMHKLVQVATGFPREGTAPSHS